VIACNLVFAAGGVAAPNFLMRDKNSPHAFTTAQMGRYDTHDAARNTGQVDYRSILCGRGRT
jgi:hypothetical protein